MTNEEKMGKKQEGVYGFVCIIIVAAVFVLVCFGSVFVGIRIGEGKKTDLEGIVEKWEEEMDGMEEMLLEMDRKLDRVSEDIKMLDEKTDVLIPVAPQAGTVENNNDVNNPQQNIAQPAEEVQK